MLSFMQYEHTQRSPLYLVVYLAAGAMAAGAWASRMDTPIAFTLLGVAAIMVLLGESFRHLRVRDEGEHLAVRFGPIPLFFKRIRYADITDVEPDRSKIIDGWGIHYTLGRGWTFNLWGFDCVKLTLGRKVIRVGTDDVENLTEFLRSRIGGG